MRRVPGLPATIPLLVAILLVTATSGSAADVSFASAVAPALVETCSGCHGDDRPRSGFSVTTFAQLMRGGRSGPAILAGKGAESLLVKKIKGTDIEGQRMPIGRPPLSADLIASIEQWIDQGAKLDALSAQDTLAAVASAGRVRAMPHDELLKHRFEAAEKLWRRALPDEQPIVAPRDGLVVIGNAKATDMASAAVAGEKAAAAVRRLLVNGDAPLVKGGMAVFVFTKPVDYSEFWEVVLHDERPKGLVANAGMIGDVAYGAFVFTAANIEAFAAEQIAAAALVARGVPAWFAGGAGRMAAMKVAPKAPVVKAWRREPFEHLQRLESAEDYFDGRAGPVAIAGIGGGFIPSIAKSESRLRAFIEAIDAGASFDKAFADVFKESPQSLFAAWAAKEWKKPAAKSAGR
ncbi:MAG: c-type cytochrome domain-containing protein [Planctomycetia bacterium]